MPRALIIVLDSVGIGGAEDAAAYGDAGADTVGHIAEACARGEGDRARLREGPLHLPNLVAFGLGLACEASTGRMPPNLEPFGEPAGRWGYGVETSRGKDTPSGHWEIAGVPVDFDWGYFPNSEPAFPPELTKALIAEAQLPGILGDRHASGTAILDELGAEHIRTAKPICYTSVDSVFQIAAHEEAFGLERLYEVCRVARRLCDPYRIGRVIARPFVGSPATGFTRTPNRKDFSTPPPADTILDVATKAGRAVVTVGKIGDIFAHRGTGEEVKPAGNDACLSAALAALGRLADGGFIFANLVDFDSDYGHRRDVAGLCGGARGLRPPRARDLGGARAQRPRDHHRRPRQRSDLARHRPHPRAHPDPRLRPRPRRRRDRPPRDACRHRRDRRGASRPADARSGKELELIAAVIPGLAKREPGTHHHLRRRTRAIA